jgi:hypothetical protein
MTVVPFYDGRMMVEIPSNVILLPEFAEYFDASPVSVMSVTVCSLLTAASLSRDLVLVDVHGKLVVDILGEALP